MGAIFYKYGNSMLMHSVGPGGTPASIDLFQDLAGESNMTIITGITVQNVDTYQFFTTFDDFIHYYYFGKGLGNMQISGVMFLDCNNSEIPGINTLYNKIGQKRGQTVTVTFGNQWFQGPLTDCSVSLISEPETMANFTINMAMTNHGLPAGQTTQSGC